MVNYDYIIKENMKNHNPNGPPSPDHSYRILIVGGSGSGKTNALLNLIKQQDDGNYSDSVADKIYTLTIQMTQNISILLKSMKAVFLNDWKTLIGALIEYSVNMQDVCKNIE